MKRLLLEKIDSHNRALVLDYAQIPLRKRWFSSSTSYRQIVGLTGFFNLKNVLEKGNTEIHWKIELVSYPVSDGGGWVNTHISSLFSFSYGCLNIWWVIISFIYLKYGFCESDQFAIHCATVNDLGEREDWIQNSLKINLVSHFARGEGAEETYSSSTSILTNSFTVILSDCYSVWTFARRRQGLQLVGWINFF